MRKKCGVVAISFLVALMSGCTFLGDLSKKLTKSFEGGDQIQEQELEQAYLKKAMITETSREIWWRL